ncbi:MAG: helix-turn-helix domain-containing protein [Blautia sp.]|nr:helix-turn-helix domain-containing protein [Blautia sp.]
MKFFTPLPHFTPESIRRTRESLSMTRPELAAYLGVTAKAVEAWEYGKSQPSGPVCRLLSLLPGSAEEGIYPAEGSLLFEVLSPKEVHFLHGRTFIDPRYNITVTWKDGKDMLYLDFRYLGRKYHIPARQRYRDREDNYELLCKLASEVINEYLLRKELEKWM